MQKVLIGLIGPIASGKGTAANFLKEKGYSHYSLSDRIKEEIIKNNLPVNRRNLHLFGNEMRKQNGSDVLAKKTAELIDSDNNQKIVIDSIRNPDEVRFLQNKFGAKIIGVTASPQKRFELMQARADKGDPQTWEEFEKIDTRELTNTDPTTQQVNETFKLADIVIKNNGTIDDLRKKIEEII